jgi:hypothetical protein
MDEKNLRRLGIIGLAAVAPSLGLVINWPTHYIFGMPTLTEMKSK